MDLPKLPPRNTTGHKGTFGTVAVVGGMQTRDKVMFGGAVLAAIAALRAGAGRATLVMPRELLTAAIELLPQAVGIPLSTNSEFEANCVLFGPSAGIQSPRKQLLTQLLQQDTPLVIDADGLNILAVDPHIWNKDCDTILTPHIGEFRRLVEAFHIDTQVSLTEQARTLAKKLDTVLVVKSSSTIICDKSRSWVLNQPNPALATAGSGDVLGGIIAGLVAQFYLKLDMFQLAQLGVTLHNHAAKLWSDTHGDQGLIFDELLELIPKATEDLR